MSQVTSYRYEEIPLHKWQNFDIEINKISQVNFNQLRNYMIVLFDEYNYEIVNEKFMENSSLINLTIWTNVICGI